METGDFCLLGASRIAREKNVNTSHQAIQAEGKELFTKGLKVLFIHSLTHKYLLSLRCADR